MQSCSLKQNFNAKPVPTMTQDRFNTGYVQGNTEIDIDLTIAVQNLLARPKLETIPFATADVQLTFIRSDANGNQSDHFVAKGLFMKTTDDDAPGIGEEGKARFALGALKLVDAVGNSLLFNVSLG